MFYNSHHLFHTIPTHLRPILILELYIIVHFNIYFLVGVEIHLGQTTYASQSFQMQGSRF